MSDQMLMQVGRVVFINQGPCTEKLAVVVDIIDENRILVDGPTTGVERQVMPTKRIMLTKFRINKVLRNQKVSALKKNIEAYGLEKKWNATGFATKLNNQRKRASLSDFDRHKAMVLRRRLAKTVRAWVKNNKTKG